MCLNSSIKICKVRNNTNNVQIDNNFIVNPKHEMKTKLVTAGCLTKRNDKTRHKSTILALSSVIAKPSRMLSVLE